MEETQNSTDSRCCIKNSDKKSKMLIKNNIVPIKDKSCIQNSDNIKEVDLTEDSSDSESDERSSVIIKKNNINLTNDEDNEIVIEKPELIEDNTDTEGEEESHIVIRKINFDSSEQESDQKFDNIVDKKNNIEEEEYKSDSSEKESLLVAKENNIHSTYQKNNYLEVRNMNIEKVDFTDDSTDGEYPVVIKENNADSTNQESNQNNEQADAQTLSPFSLFDHFGTVKRGFKPRGRSALATSGSTQEPKTGFFVDVPPTWGIAADGSMVDCFSKMELDKNS